LLALVFGIALALLAHALDPMVRQPVELERMGIPIAGSIPRDEGSPHLSS
jgi:capsular polysaccharide biosynthesis protein